MSGLSPQQYVVIQRRGLGLRVGVKCIVIDYINKSYSLVIISINSGG